MITEPLPDYFDSFTTTSVAVAVTQTYKRTNTGDQKQYIARRREATSK